MITLENETRRVVWIPNKLGKEVEETCKEMGYTRSAFYRYALSRLLERMSILSKRKEIQLRPWEEICGTLIGLEQDDFKISAVLSQTHNKVVEIAFFKGSQEAIVLTQCLNSLLGRKITILKTDRPQQPIIIKPVAVTTEAMKRVLKTDVTHTDSMHCRSNQT